MTRINTNISSLTAQTSLSRSNRSLQTSLTRLSTGLRINSGKDDPAGLIASEVLRSEIISIGQSIKNSERANSAIATVDAALGEVSTLLSDIRSLVQASANKGATSASEIAANQVQLNSALDSIDRIAQTTVFGGQKLLNGTKSFNVSAAGGSLGAFASSADINIKKFNPALHSSTAGDDLSIAVSTAATKRTVTFTGQDATIGNGQTLNDLSTTSTRATATILGAGGANDIADLDAGGGANTFTLTITGSLGASATAAINVQAAQADSSVVTAAINAVSNATGVIASGTGAGGNITVSTLKVGANANPLTITGVTSAGGGEDAIITGAIGATTAGTTGATQRTTTFELIGDLGRSVITVNNDDVINNTGVLRDAINAVSSTTGVSASGTGLGANLTLTSRNYGSAAILTANAIAATSAGDITTFNHGSTQAATAGLNAAGTVTHAFGSGSFSAVGEVISYSDSSIEFTATTDPTLGTLTASVDVSGGALFQLGPAVNYANQINVNITSLDLATLGRNNTNTGNAGLGSLRGGGANSLDKADLSDAASIVEQAIGQIATLRGELGALQKNVIETNIRSLESGLEQVTAAESSIRDADFAAETAALTRNQILVQAGTTVLTIANSSPQNVLALLQR